MIVSSLPARRIPDNANTLAHLLLVVVQAHATRIRLRTRARRLVLSATGNRGSLSLQYQQAIH
jgi:hypothetical protein